MKIIKLITLIYIFLLLYNCSEKTIYSGKIINSDNFDYANLNNKQELIDKLGQANYIDPIENKFFYYTEKTKYKNVFNEIIENRIILVVKFNNDNTIQSINEFDLNDENEIKFSKDEIKNNLIKRGLIERFFGGVSREIPNTSN
tara:strand:+ start:1941 stop:2372 length:432 start_codon:yes stop_codon:yes gene_type:complete